MATRSPDQRLVLALVANTALVGATCLAMSALKEQIFYFCTPTNLARAHLLAGRGMRFGGMVERGPLKRLSDGVTIAFVVTDGLGTMPVTIAGIVPDRFHKRIGVIADGRILPSGVSVPRQSLLGMTSATCCLSSNDRCTRSNSGRARPRCLALRSGNRASHHMSADHRRRRTTLG